MSNHRHRHQCITLLRVTSDCCLESDSDGSTCCVLQLGDLLRGASQLQLATAQLCDACVAAAAARLPGANLLDMATLMHGLAKVRCCSHSPPTPPHETSCCPNCEAAAFQVLKSAALARSSASVYQQPSSPMPLPSLILCNICPCDSDCSTLPLASPQQYLYVLLAGKPSAIRE